MTALPRPARVLAAVGALCLGVAGALAVAAPASAVVDSYTVHNLLGDPTDVDSLPWAVAQAEGDPDASTIDFEAGLTGSIPLTSTLLITHDLTINGPGSGVITVVGPAANTDNVIDISSTGVAPAVAVSGLTVAPSGVGNSTGVRSNDGDLTLLDVMASGFNDSGIDVSHASLTATLLEADNNGLDGITHAGDSGDDLVLDRITANDNSATGVFSTVLDGDSRISTVSAAGSASYGVTVTVDGGTLVASGIAVDGAGLFGISIAATNGAVAQLSDSTVTGAGASAYGFGITSNAATVTVEGATADANDGTGFQLAATNGGVTTLTGSTITNNELGGAFVISFTGSQVTIDSSRIEHNGYGPCLCGGSGVTVIADDSAVSISGTSIVDNRAQIGGGVYVFGLSNDSSLAISGSSIDGNHAVDAGSGAGGGLAVDSAVIGLSDDSTLSVTDSSISGNDAELEGGGVALYDLGAGAPTGSVTFLRTTIDGNTVTGAGCGCSTAGGGILLAGAEANSAGGPVLSIQQSTISGNSVVGGDGGGLYLAQGPATSTALVDVLGSTISGNSADGDGAAVYLETVSANPGTLQARFRYSTIAANTITGGGVGGVFVDGVNLELTLDSTIIADNGSDDLSFDPAIGLFAASYSLVQSPVGAGIPLDPTQGNLTGANPTLGPLANNGGPTMTMLISRTGPAYNAGDPAFAGLPATDQRGLARVYQVIDIGAVELQAPPAPPAPTAAALAVTGWGPTPGPPLVALLLLLTGVAMVAFSRLRPLRPSVPR